MESLEGRFSSFGASVESITKSLEEKQINHEVVMKKISSVSEVLNSHWMKQFEGYSIKQPHENFRIRMFSKQLEEVCIGLWNTTVAKYTAKKLQGNSDALLRQLCCDIIQCPLCKPCDVTNREARNAVYMHRKIMMQTKTGKSWMNQCEYDKAVVVLKKGLEDVKCLHEIVRREVNQKDDDRNDADTEDFLQVNRYKIKLFTLLAETSMGQGAFDEALLYCSEASTSPYLFKEQFSVELTQLSVLTYNFGLKCFRGSLLDSAIKWLQFNLQLWRKHPKNNKMQMSQTLRLLAHAYHDTNLDENQSKALEAIEEANQLHSHPGAILLKLKILTKTATCDVIKELLCELLHHTELQVDLGLDACAFLNTNGRFDICEFGLNELLSCFTGSQHVGRVHAQRLQAAIDRLPSNDAVDYVEKFLEDEELVQTLDETSHKLVQLLLWEQAAKKHDAGDMQMCLSWYTISQQLFNICKTGNEKERNENISKLFRNKASCLIQLNKLDEAETCANEALKLDNGSIFSLYTAFKVFVMQQRTDKAIETINKISTSAVTSSGDLHTITCLAAQLAFEKNQRDVAMATLSHLVATGKDDSAKLTALRCLVRLHLTMAEDEQSNCDIIMQQEAEESVSLDSTEQNSRTSDEKMEIDATNHIAKAASYVEDAYKIMEQLKANDLHPKLTANDMIELPSNSGHMMNTEEFNKEVTWFMKIAWNLALRDKKYPEKMRDMFISCNDLLSLLPHDGSVLVRRQTCLLMSAASGLECVRSGVTKHVNNELQNVVQHLDECQTICNDLKKLGVASAASDRTLILMSLYRFEALCKLHPPSGHVIPTYLKSLLEEIADMNGTDATTFESLAALSVEAPARHLGLYKLSLKHAITKINHQMELATKDNIEALINKRSVLYRTLAEKLLTDGGVGEKEQSWNLFCEIYNAQQGNKFQHPDVELLWLTVRSWNVGASAFTTNQLSEAEKWTCLSMKFLAMIPSYKEAYEPHMNVVYQQILSSKHCAGNTLL